MPHDFTADGLVDLAADRLSADPDLDNLHTGDVGDSDLDDLRAELRATIADTTTIEVLGRPGYAVRCRLDFTGKDLDLIRKRARDKTFADGIDGIKYAGLVLGFTCVAIVRKGQDLELDGVSPVTFATPALQELMGTGSVYETVRALFGRRDGHIDAATKRLLIDAGWGDEAFTADPTQ